MKRTSQPLLVAIVGGSGSGKSWLAERLQALLGRRARCVSLDDFYRDRSHLSPRRRATLNFDHPRAIDWESVETVLQKLAAGEPAKLPSYDFRTHCRRSRLKVLRPASVVLVDGLWLLRRPAIRRLFQCRVFIACPGKVRLRRRLNRDMALRARSEESVRRQFRSTVQPMHARFVEPQKALGRRGAAL